MSQLAHFESVVPVNTSKQIMLLSPNNVKSCLLSLAQATREGLVRKWVDFDQEFDEEAAALTVIHPNRVTRDTWQWR